VAFHSKKDKETSATENSEERTWCVQKR